MTDTRGALMAALVSRLDGQVGSGVAVYSDIPDNTPPPVVIIDQLSREDVGGKGSPLDLYTVEVLSVIKATSRKPLNAIMDLVRARLNGHQPTATGLTFSPITFIGDDDSALEDGVKIGRSRFQLHVQTT